MKQKLRYRIAAFGLGLILAGCSRVKDQPLPPRVVRYAVATLFQQDQWPMQSSYIGQIRGDNETDLSFKIPGILDVIGPDKTQDWREGSRVSNGQLLARLVQSDFINNLSAARAKVGLERKLHERSIKLLETQVISQQEYDVIEANWKASEADLAKAEQALKDSELRAPYEGTLLARMATVGETIAAGRTVLRVADMRQMSVELGVPDRVVDLAAKLRERNQVIPVKISALSDEVFDGHISEVGVAAREGARLFKVVIKVPNPQGKIKSGMTASVSFGRAEETRPPAVLIPLSALVAASTSAATHLAVFVIGEDGRVEERPIQTDEIVRNSIIVLQGLRAGEKVVVAGASELHSGDRVDARRGID